MSIPALIQWAERGFKTVSENGTRWQSVRLTSDGQTWMTWDAPFLEPAAWAQEAAELLDQLAAEFPVKRCALLFTAEDSTGGIIAQHPHSVMGRNKQAAEFGAQGASKAMSEAMRSLAETMDAVLKTARDQMAAQSLRIEADQEEIRALHDLMRAQREAEAVAVDQSNAVSDILIGQLKEAGPLVMQGLELVMSKAAAKAKQQIPDAAAAVANAVKNPNGAS
jgi:hypothetical protein